MQKNPRNTEGYLLQYSVFTGTEEFEEACKLGVAEIPEPMMHGECLEYAFRTCPILHHAPFIDGEYQATRKPIQASARMEFYNGVDAEANRVNIARDVETGYRHSFWVVAIPQTAELDRGKSGLGYTFDDKDILEVREYSKGRPIRVKEGQGEWQVLQSEGDRCPVATNPPEKTLF